ncbi:MAG: NADH-quinone oxidoreductase subunit NuoE [Firmicutes bacterium]|nr:NADH-quinone oxidoreductase subunit NuoE [Bacillota bacterium]
MLAAIDIAKVDAIVKQYPDPADSLIAVLQDVQDAYGYLPESILLRVSSLSGIPAAALSGVATFYAQFRLTPPGIYQILVCMGTACHVNGAGTVAEAVEEALGVQAGVTTADGLFSWEKVACLGCCSLSPVMMVNGRVYGKLTRERVREVLQAIREEALKHAPGGDS